MLFVLLVCRWRPWDLFDEAGFSTDFYDEQARSFLRLRLAVRPEVAGHEGFLIDGRTYLYYGPFLALVRLPFALFGDVFAQRLTRISMIVGFVVWCTGAYHLVTTAQRWAHERWAVVSATVSAWRTGVFVAAAACSPVLFLTGWVSVYHETELWAATFAVWAFVAALRTVMTGSQRDAALTAAFVAATTLTRASVGLGVAAGVGLVALVSWRRIRRCSIVLLVGCIGGFAVHAAINWAKFGSPTALPADRQVLTLQDPTRAAWFAGNHDSFFSTRFLPTTLVQYLRPDTIRFERLVPFLRYGPLARDRGSYPVESVTPASSLTAAATLLCVVAAVGLVVIARRRDAIWGSLVAGAAIAAVPTFTIGFIANRYLVDMMPLLLLPAAAAMVAVSLPHVERWRRLWQVVAVACVAWAAWCNVALATWTQNLKEPGFTELRYRVDSALFGGSSPGLEVIEAGSSVPRDGIVGLALVPDTSECEAVYIAEQGAWVALERLDGTSQVRGTIDLAPRDAQFVAGSDTWTVTLERDGDRARAVFDDGTATTGEWIDVAGVDVAVTVVDDMVIGQFFVAVEGRTSLFRFGTPPGAMVPGDSLRPGAPPTDETLCHLLQGRR
ncbi:MAG: hypothetical protein AB7L17_22380 [Ilumatobacteraceae bacterium]